MRLRVSMASAGEDIVALLNRGYAVLSAIEQDYATRKQAGRYSKDGDIPRYKEQISRWGEEVTDGLIRIFPTALERNVFLNPEIPLVAVSGDYEYSSMVYRLRCLIRGLEAIRTTYLPQYTDLPIEERLYVEHIDSFQKVRDVNPAMVAGFLENGFLSLSEELVQLALEQILAVSFHRKDWAGEINDLFTANVVVNGSRRATAFLLKGPGIGRKELVIAGCGKNGDQVVRLFETPATLFVVQYVGPVGDMLVKDVEGKTAALRRQGKAAHFLIIDGQDTARVLHAYGKL